MSQHSELDTIRQAKLVISAIYTFYYKMQSLVEAFFRRTLEALEDRGTVRPEKDRLAVVYEAAFERLALVVKDVETIMSEIAAKTFSKVKELNRPDLLRGREIPGYYAPPGVTEADKMRSLQRALACIRGLAKVSAHQRQIGLALKNFMLASRVFGVFERREIFVKLKVDSVLPTSRDKLMEDHRFTRMKQREPEITYTRRYQNGLHVFVKVDSQTATITSCSVFTHKDCEKESDADTLPDRRNSASFSLTIVARKAADYYEGIAGGRHHDVLTQFLTWVDKFEQIFVRKCERCGRLAIFDHTVKEITYPILFQDLKTSKGQRVQYYYHPSCLLNNRDF